MNNENTSFIETELSFDEITNSSYETQSSNVLTKKNSGRPFGKVWEHITKGKEISRGHYEGTCNYCKKYWNNAKPSLLRSHLASHCSKCPNNIVQEFLKIIATKNSELNENKRQKISDSSSTSIQKQSIIENHYEIKKISNSRQNDIDNALIKAFVCCNLAFSIIENPFFKELLKTLSPGYQIPSRKKLYEFLEYEVAQINLKVQKIYEENNNLTLGIYIIYLSFNYLL